MPHREIRGHLPKLKSHPFGRRDGRGMGADGKDKQAGKRLSVAISREWEPGPRPRGQRGPMEDRQGCPRRGSGAGEREGGCGRLGIPGGCRTVAGGNATGWWAGHDEAPRRGAGIRGGESPRQHFRIPPRMPIRACPPSRGWSSPAFAGSSTPRYHFNPLRGRWGSGLRVQRAGLGATRWAFGPDPPGRVGTPALPALARLVARRGP